MSLPPNSGDSHADEDPRIEEAIAEYLMAEDERQPLDIPVWLEKHSAVRDRLQSFLENHQRATDALGPRPIPGWTPFQGQLHDTLEFTPSNLTRQSTVRASLEPIQSVGGYRLRGLLGSGGMGRVYEAIDGEGHRFAIKLIAGHMATTSEAVERFKQEGIVASGINHPRCVFVHEADTADGQPFIAMELMSGTTLRDLVVAGGPLQVDDAIEKIIDVVDGLAEAHACNLIHRDVKPSNCYVDDEGRAKVGDFGLAKSIEADLDLTRTGSIVGTPLFASPEQLRGEMLDPRSDVYSTCATLYYLLIGKAPFEHSHATTVIAKVLSEDVGSIRTLRPDIPVGLDQLLQRGMSRNREMRPRDMQELREALEEFVPGKRRLASLGIRLAAFCVDVAILSLVFLLVAMMRPDWFADPDSMLMTVRFESQILSSAMQAIYFFVCERVFRTTLGKRFLGLKVIPFDQNRLLSTVQIVVRVGVWWLLSGAASDLLMYGLGRTLVSSYSDPLHWIGYGVGYGLICLPLLWRSDQRMLHDLASGTQVESAKASSAVRLAMPIVRSFQTQPIEPFMIGRFSVDGVLETFESAEWLTATDPRLNRRVWICRRNAAGSMLSDARRRMVRPMRLRWICSGMDADQRWDAFMGVDSVPIAELQKAGESLGWAHVRPALIRLAEELEQVQRDGEPVELMLRPELLRVTFDGRLVCLDGFPINSPVKTTSTQQERLQFVHQVATMLLGSDNRELDRTDPSIPFHAHSILDRLLASHPSGFESVSAFLAAMRSVEDRPAAPTIRNRAIQIATQIALGMGPFGAMLAIIGLGHLIRIDEIEDELLRLYTLRYVTQSETAEASLAAIGRAAAKDGPSLPIVDAGWQERLARKIDTFEKLQEALASRNSEIDLTTLRSAQEVYINADLLPLLLPSDELASQDRFVWQLPETLPVRLTPFALGPKIESVDVNPVMRATFAGSGEIDADELYACMKRLEQFEGHRSSPRKWRVLIIPLALWGILATWGMLFRGGIGRRAGGLVVVDARGKLASRPRLLWRSLLLWAPIGLMISVTVFLEYLGLASPLVSGIMRTCCVVAPFVYIAWGLLWSGRGLHDRLTGTRMVVL